MLQIHKELEESAAMSGASWATTFRRIILPLLKPGLVAGWIYIVIVSIRELSSSILLYSPGTEVLSIVIWELWENGQYVELSALGVLFILGLFVLVLAAQWIGRRFGIRELSAYDKRALHRLHRRARPGDPRRQRRRFRTCRRASSSRCSAPSGCGKTTTPALDRGARAAAAGRDPRRRRRGVFVGARVFVPPNQRGLGMVFQSYAIWPHMTVFENAGLSAAVGPAKRFGRESWTSASCGCSKPWTWRTWLSGGDQALRRPAAAPGARAGAGDGAAAPALGRAARTWMPSCARRMRFELKRLQRELASPRVRTHDQSEALALSHSIA